MARKWGRIVSITALVLIVITGIVVGTLFAVGVLHVHKNGSSSPGPKPSPGPSPGPSPLPACNTVPTLKSFERKNVLGYDGMLYRLNISPIAENCSTDGQFWTYNYTFISSCGLSSGTQQAFTPYSGQNYIDINMPVYPNPERYPCQLSYNGEIWIEVVSKDGTKSSNKLPYTIINN